MRALVILIFLLLAGPGVSLASGYWPVVFMYHRFGESKYPSTNIRMEQFRAHLELLEDLDVRIIDMPEFLQIMQQGTPLPERTALLTADDAYASVYTHAWPVLREKQIPFAVFVASDPVDQGYDAYMNWEQMREMARGGVTFGNHSASHPYFLDTWNAAQRDAFTRRFRAEVLHAEERIRDELGPQPRVFAYPFGEYNRAMEDVLRSLGYLGFSQFSGPISDDLSPVALPRFPMNENYGAIKGFRTKALTQAFEFADAPMRDPLVGAGERPAIELHFDSAEDANLDRLTCFDAEGNSMQIERNGLNLTAVPVAPAVTEQRRRGRYNCTAPVAGTPFSYAWHSQFWIRAPHADPLPATAAPSAEPQ